MCRYLKTILYVMFFMSVLHVTNGVNSGVIMVFQQHGKYLSLSGTFNSTELPYSLKEYDLSQRTGKIVLANPPDACSPILGPPNQTSFHLFSYNFFVLIDGSSCNYITKVSNAQSAGFSAAVIYVYKSSNDEHEEILQGSLPNIIAVLINFYDGITIRDKFLYTLDESYLVEIGPVNSDWLIWLGGTLAVVAVICFIFFLSREYGHLVLDCQCPSLKRRTHLKELETVPFKTGDPYETCEVCSEDFEVNDNLKLLSCGCAYHAACIDQWLTEKKKICPACKKQVIFQQASPNSAVTINQSEATPLLHS